MGVLARLNGQSYYFFCAKALNRPLIPAILRTLSSWCALMAESVPTLQKVALERVVLVKKMMSWVYVQIYTLIQPP
jgi:hypothetical protein